MHQEGAAKEIMTLVTVAQAAQYFKKTPSTIRRWIQSGCPGEPGSVGRGRGSHVDLEQMARWRVAQCVPAVAARAADDILAIAETALLQSLRCDDLANRVKISEAQAALAVVIIFERLYLIIKEQSLEPPQLPEQLRHLCANLIPSIESGNFQRR